MCAQGARPGDARTEQEREEKDGFETPIDIAAHVSPELSAVIEGVLEDPDREQPPTLEDVRASLKEESKR